MTQYLVRFAFTMDAKTPEDSVAGVVDLFVEKGLRNWLYRVDNPETGDIIGFYDGYGDPVDMSSLPGEEADDTAEPTDGEEAAPEATAEPVADPEPVTDDPELHALAESLNAE